MNDTRAKSAKTKMRRVCADKLNHIAMVWFIRYCTYTHGDYILSMFCDKLRNREADEQFWSNLAAG